jgi:iron complex transport system ATP-binding protein
MESVLNFDDVTVSRGGKQILGPISWEVGIGERWVILGPNGAGKTTLFQIAATQMHPTSGKASILGSMLGKVDVFDLRPRIGLMGSSLLGYFPEDEKVIDVVLTAAYGILGRWREEYELWDESRAVALLTTLGVRELASRDFFTLSDGEKKRTMIARALMANPELLLLDEPASGLDLGGREDLLQRLENLAGDEAAPATIIITHHIEEIPTSTTHALLLREGRVVASGMIREVLTDEFVSATYGLPIKVTQIGNRFTASAF